MSSDLARLFDAMADSYDELEPWYEHLYAVLHAILRAELAPTTAGGRALDAGCGTGFQTTHLQDLGYATHGVDLSAALLAVARRRLPNTALTRASIEALPFADEQFDVVTCCGSTLSFVGDPSRVLGELGRVLRPGGRLLLECEHKWSLDLAWAGLSGLAFDVLGYGISPSETWHQLWRPWREGFILQYPSVAADGRTEYMKLRLFTTAELGGMLHDAGMTPRRWWGLHSVTNLLPSTLLHRPRLGWVVGGLFGLLRRADAALAARAVGRRLANSLVVVAEKQGAARPWRPSAIHDVAPRRFDARSTLR